MEQIKARDGAALAVHSTGSGPGIVVVHGGGVTIEIYRRLAAALAGRGFTVHLYNRRGRADAPPRTQPYTFQEDVDDLAVVLEQTGASNVIGHSSGGAIALLGALHLPIERLALYDPAVSVDGNAPSGWLPSAQQALRDGRTARALAIVGAAINPQMPASRLPMGVQTLMIRLFLRTGIGRTMGELLPLTLQETEQALAHDGPAEQWAGVTAEVLLACGADGPPYYAPANEALARALPRATAIEIPRSGHDAINRAHARVVDPLAGFFAEG